MSDGALFANSSKSWACFLMSPPAPVSADENFRADSARSLQLPLVAKFGVALVVFSLVVVVAVVSVVAVVCVVAVVWVVAVSVGGVDDFFEPPPQPASVNPSTPIATAAAAIVQRLIEASPCRAPSV